MSAATAWKTNPALVAKLEITPSRPLLQAGAFGGDADRGYAALATLNAWWRKYHRGF